MALVREGANGAFLFTGISYVKGYNFLISKTKVEN
jgi:hypothetical protein